MFKPGNLIRIAIASSMTAFLSVSLPAASALAGSFAYSVNVRGHEVVITGLADGTFYLKLDGVVHRPEKGKIQVIFPRRDETEKDSSGQPQVVLRYPPELQVEVRDKGKKTEISGGSWMTHEEWPGKSLRNENVYINVGSAEIPEDASVLMSNHKPIYRTYFDLTGGSKKPAPIAARTYSFYYFFKDGQRTFRVGEMLPSVFGKAPLSLFMEVVKTMQKRDVEPPQELPSPQPPKPQ